MLLVRIDTSALSERKHNSFFKPHVGNVSPTIVYFLRNTILILANILFYFFLKYEASYYRFMRLQVGKCCKSFLCSSKIALL